MEQAIEKILQKRSEAEHCSERRAIMYHGMRACKNILKTS
jgi:hypothetical protein